jgi:hypothetical protein
MNTWIKSGSGPRGKCPLCRRTIERSYSFDPSSAPVSGASGGVSIEEVKEEEEKKRPDDEGWNNFNPYPPAYRVDGPRREREEEDRNYIIENSHNEWLNRLNDGPLPAVHEPIRNFNFPGPFNLREMNFAEYQQGGDVYRLRRQVPEVGGLAAAAAAPHALGFMNNLHERSRMMASIRNPRASMRR